MTEKHIAEIKKMLRDRGEVLGRMYSPYEGGFRVIGRSENGTETRYAVSFDADGAVSLAEM